MNLCLSACGRVVVNKPIAGTDRGMHTLVMSNYVLSIAMLTVSSSKWGSFFDVVDSGLRVRLTELYIYINSKPPPEPRRRSCRTRV